MSFKIAISNPEILLSHKFKNTRGRLKVAIAISKKVSKKAVDRNKIKRRIKEIIRKNGYSDFLSNGFVFSVFRPFAELSYENANKEIQEAIEEIKKIS